MKTLPRNCSATNSASLEVHLLGTVDFDAALFLQERMVYELSGRADAQGALLICEHPPLVTVGREGSRAHIRCSDEELRARLLETRWLNRGGGCLVHVPGQLAIYPILPLARLELGLTAYRRTLENAVIDACRKQRIVAQRDEDRPGVFCRTGQLAHVGFAMKSWVTYHGMFLNVFPRLSWSKLAQATDNAPPITSLQRERNAPISMHAVRESLIRHLSARWGYEQHHVYTGHHLWGRTRKANVYA
jgi:lipoyl(octanoyl) transferase